MIAIVQYSNDFESWTRPVELLRADERDGDPDTQIHEFSVTRRGDQLIGLSGMMRISQLLPSESYLTLEESPCDVELTCSRDGGGWHRVADRQVFMPAQTHGPPDYDHRRATTESPRPRNEELDASGNYQRGARSLLALGEIDRGLTFHMLGAHMLFDDEKVYIFYGATTGGARKDTPTACSSPPFRATGSRRSSRADSLSRPSSRQGRSTSTPTAICSSTPTRRWAG